MSPSATLDVRVVVDHAASLAVTPLVRDVDAYLEPTVVPVNMLLAVAVDPGAETAA